MSSAVALHIKILPDHLEPVGNPLPRIWVGFVLASLCFFSDSAGWLEGSSSTRETFFGLGLFFSMAAWVYWALLHTPPTPNSKTRFTIHVSYWPMEGGFAITDSFF
jgi:hypothetical protein